MSTPSDESRLLDLIVQWAHLEEAGQNPRVEDICRDAPELLTQFDEHLRRLQRMRQFLASAAGETCDAALSPATRDAPPRAAGSSAAGDADFELGETAVPGFEILGELGRGGMGRVLHGRDLELGREVAVKLLLESHAQRADSARRFIEEAQIQSQLQHPGVAPIYALGKFADERPFFAMKVVQGQTLSELLQRRKDPADERPRFLKIFEQVCQTVGYAHSRRVIHRDLKPGNVMVGAFGEVQVMDWGLGKVLSAQTPSPPDGAMPSPPPRTLRSTRGNNDLETMAGIGTLAYMPPEQASGEPAEVDERADVFALGAILCEILTGDPPYLAESRTRLYHRAAKANLDDAFLRLEASGADQELIGIARRCLAARAEERPRDAIVLAGQVAAYLESVQDRLRQAELDKAAAEVQSREERKRKRVWVGLASAVVVLFALVGAGAMWWQTQRAETARQASSALSSAEQWRAEAQRIHAPLEPGSTEADRGAMARERQQIAAAALAAWRHADAALQQAESALELGFASDDARKQAAALRVEIDEAIARVAREEQLFAGLDAARMARVTWVDATTVVREELAEAAHRPPKLGNGSFDYGDSHLRYAQAFADYGIDLSRGGPALWVRQIRAAPPAIREELIAAIDDWIDVARELKMLGIESSPNASDLLDFALAADDDAERNEMRQMAWDADVVRLQAVAAQAERKKLPPSLLEPMARAMARGGRRADALALARSARAAYPNDFWIQLHLAATLDFGRPSEAELRERIGCLWTAVALRPDAAAAYNNLGSALKDGGDMPGALAAYRKALEINPRLLPAHHNQGLALMDAGDAPAAVASLQRGLEINPRNAGTLYSLGGALRDNGQFDEAEAALRQAIALRPRYAEAHNNLGQLLAARGNLPAAIDEYRQALDINPRLVESHINLAAALGNQGDVQAAADWFRKALEIEPRDAEVQVNYGVALSQCGDLSGAIAAYQAAIAIDPDCVEAHYNLGNALEKSKDNKGAIAAFRRAIEIDPRHAKAHCNLGIRLWKAGDPAAGLAAIRKAIEIDPKLVNAYYNLGLVLAKQDDQAAAIDAYRAAISHEPRHARAHNSLAIALALHGDLPAALAACRKAIELDPTNPEAHLNLGSLLARNNDVPGAVAAYRKAIEVRPKYVGAYYNLGRVLKNAGELPAAIDALRSAIAIDPELAIPQADLGEAYLRSGQLDAASQHLAKSLELLPATDPRRPIVVAQLEQIRQASSAGTEPLEAP